VCVDQRTNALAYGSRFFKKPLTLDEYLAARPIAEPIHLFDCVMPCAGAEAFLVMSEARARDLGLAYATVRGSIERHNAFSEDPVMMRGGWHVDRDDLYAMADCTPADIGFLQTYDDYPVIVMMQFEGLGFCGHGEAPAVRAQPQHRVERRLPAQHLGRAAVVGPGRLRRRLSGHERGAAADHRRGGRPTRGPADARPGQRLRHGHLRPLPVHRCRDPGEPVMTRAERRAAPKPARIPSGDRPMYPSDEGLQ
jgi:hypothetical protein